MTARASAWAVLVAFSAAGAQSPRELRLEGGAARVRQNGRDARDALVLGALFRDTDDRVATVLSGTVTYARDSIAAAEGVAAVALRPSARSRLQTEGGISAAAFGVSIVGRGGSFSAYARERVNLFGGGFWAGASSGQTRRDGISSSSTSLDAGALVQADDIGASLSYARVRSSDFSLLDAAGIHLSRDAAAHDIEDVSAALRYEHGPLSVDLSQRWRGGRRATSVRQTASFVSASWVVSPRFSITLASGHQLADPLHGTPDAQLVLAALRIAMLPPHYSPSMKDRASAQARLLARPEGALLVVRVVASDSVSRAEIAGTFNDWQPIPMRRTGNRWEVQVLLPSGRHRVAVRVNGGPWRAPAPLARVRDDFGGEAGLVVVP